MGLVIHPKEGLSPLQDSGSPTSPGTSSSRSNERRRHYRFNVRGSSTADYLKGVLSVFGGGNRCQARAVLDLSLGGARFRTEERLEPGSVVRVRIQVEKLPDA